MSNDVRIIDSLDKPNAVAPQSAAPLSIQQPAPRPRDDWRAILARGGVGVVVGGLGWLIFGHDVREWLSYGAGVPLATYGPYAGLALLGAAAAKRFVFTDMIGGVPVRAWFNKVTAERIVDLAGSAGIEAARAPLPRGLQVYTPHNAVTHQPAQTVEGEIVDAPALPAPVNVGPLAIAEWLPRLDEQPHAIFAAKTKGGKSTMAKAGLKARIERGEDIFIIDPHSNGWLDLPGVGGGLNWVEVEAGMQAIIDTYQDRMRQREEYIQETGRELPHDHFPRITVVFDEANESRTMISALHSPKSNPWPRFVEIMGSGARKVGISLWLICQSALIKNLGGSVVLRRNFTIFALDHATVVELIEDEEPIKERREAIITQLGGQAFPAATVLNGQAFLLDRTGLNTMQPGSAADCAWAGWDYLNRTPRNTRRLLSKQKPETTMRASVRPPATMMPAKPAEMAPESPRTGRTDGLSQDRALIYLRVRVRQGDTREKARAWMEARGLAFQNSLYTEARRLEGK